MLVWLAAWPAAGQAPPPTPSPAAEALASAHQALAEESPGRAFELARLARAFDPDCSVEAWELMGRAASEMGELEAAHRFFRRALTFADPTERARLLARMQLARDELGLVRVDVQPGGAEVLVDGQPAEFETGDRVLLLRPGSHRLEARVEGYEPRYAIVQVTSGGEHEVHLVLPEGGPDALRPAGQPRSLTLQDRWLGGNAMLIGVGGLGLAASGSVHATLPELREPLALQVGLSFGLALGAGVNMALQGALDPELRGRLMWFRILAIPILGAAALGVGAAGWSRGAACEGEANCPADDAGVDGFAGASGTLIGVAIATMSNVGLGLRDTPLGLSLAIAFAGLAMAELAMMADALGAADRLRADPRAQSDARLLDAAASHDALAQVTGGLAVGFAAVAASSIVLSVAGEGSSDLRVAAGPGTLSVSGTF